MQIILRTLLFTFLFMLPAIAAQAAPSACNAAREGVIVYNTDHKLVQFCNGAQWIGLTAKIGGAGDTLSDLNCLDGQTVQWTGSAWTCADGGGLTALQGTDDPGACTPAKDGLIKYNASSTPPWHYCNGGTTSWLPFRLPQCQDDDAGECTLAALRSSSDPQFKASSIRCGANILGVTGTHGSGSSSAFTFTNATNAALSTLTTASAVTISGIPAGCPGEVSVSGQGSPQISVAGGAWGTTGSITNGQTLAVRLTSSASFSTAHAATISIGSTDSTWTVTTLAADTTPNAFDFTPNVTNAALSTLTTATPVTISGINTSTPVSATGAGAQISINGGAWVTSGNITNGQTLGLRLPSSASFSTAITATVNVGGVTDTWSVTTLGADTTPDAFTFADLTGQALNTQLASSAITIAGINTTTPVSVSGDGSPQIRINGGSWVTSGNITNGQTLEVRLTSANAFSTAHSATIDVGGVTDDWSVTTLAADTTPTAFDFTPNVTNANPGTLTTATAVTISGINTSTPVSVTGAGAQISINGGAWVTSGNITNGQTLGLRMTSSASFVTGITATVDVGGMADTWSVTTRAANSCTAASRTWLTNCTATVTAAAHGANGTGTITNPGGCGTTYYGSGTFACSDGAFTYSTGTCTQQTACDTTPNAFTFTDVAGTNPSTLTTAAAISISGINTSTPVSVTGTGATISINGGAWVTSGNITNGQTLAVRLTSSASFSTAMSATVNVGGVTDSWSVTTRAPSNCSVAAGTTWTVSSSTCTAPSAVAISHGSTGSSTDNTAPTTGSKTFSCIDGVATTSGTPNCATASGACTADASCSSGGKCLGPAGSKTCWYRATAVNQSCTTVCAARGGYNSATLTYAGSGGTNANCQAVVSALPVAPQCTGVGTQAHALGCGYGMLPPNVCSTGAPPTMVPFRGTTATSETATGSGFVRYCSCNN